MSRNKVGKCSIKIFIRGCGESFTIGHGTLVNVFEHIDVVSNGIRKPVGNHLKGLRQSIHKESSLHFEAASIEAV